MKGLIGIAAFALLLTSLSQAQNDFTNDTTTESITTTSDKTTSDKTTSDKTTTETDTTTSVTTSTTSVVTTTSSAVPTTSTTSAPTTTSPVPTSTTPIPTTHSTTPVSTTPIVPVTTPAPPVPVVGSWNVTDGNTTCIRAELRIRFKIPIEDTFQYIALSPTASDAESKCNGDNGTQELILVDSEYVLTMIFDKDSTNAYMTDVTFSYKLPDAQGSVYNDSKLFKVKTGNSYFCSSTDNVLLGNVTMEIFHIHIQVFGGEGNSDFGTAEECESDNQVNDLVPIAVGCALLGLVVIVLIAYFVGRRRSRQKGYQSV